MTSSLGLELERNSQQESFFITVTLMRYKQLFLDHMPAKKKKNATCQWKWLLDCSEKVVMLTCQSQHLLTLLDHVMAGRSAAITSRSVEEILFRCQSNETSSAVHSHSTVQFSI